MCTAALWNLVGLFAQPVQESAAMCCLMRPSTLHAGDVLDVGLQPGIACTSSITATVAESSNIGTETQSVKLVS